MQPIPFSAEQLGDLAGHEGRRLVSILAPMHAAGRDRREDPIRFRNLVREVEAGLAEAGAGPGEIDAMLAPAGALFDGRSFWDAGHHALALFLGEGFARLYTPPVTLPQRAVVGDRFEVSPLLPALVDGGAFYLLALAGNGWRLLQCTRWASARLEAPGAPANEEEAVEVKDPTPSLQHHTARQPAGDRAGIFHGHGVGIDDRKNHLDMYYRKLDHAVCKRLRDLPGPLVVAATESRFAQYRDLTDHPDLVSEPVLGAPDVARDDDLRKQAWSILEPRYHEARQRAEAMYRELVTKGRGVAEAPETLAALERGQVEALFVRDDGSLWGTRRDGAVEVHDQRQPDDIDLLNEMVALSVLRGSQTFLSSPEEMPGSPDDLVNAVLRW